MPQQKMMNGFETFTIVSKDASTQATFVPARGGVASSIIMPSGKQSRELLFTHDFFWDEVISDLPGGWPFCFPVCARLARQGQLGAYLYDGKLYELPIHGFAWSSSWLVEEGSSDALTLVLRDNEHTRAMYPFSFEVKLRYEVAHGQLTCQQTYHNLGDQPMPYYAGFHPYFLTPPPGAGKQKVILNYHPTRHLIYNDDLTDIAGEAPLFDLPTSVTHPEINEQLTVLGQQKEITLQYPDGDVLHMAATGVDDVDLFPYIQLHTIPEKPFICVEPWMAYPNAMNSVQGVRWLAAGQSERGLLTLWLQP